jgi:VWFA-related protein
VKKVTTSCIAMLMFVSLASAQESARLSAGAIMNRATAAYASCRSYSDQGQISVKVIAGPSRRPAVSRFFTAFLRPARFRFEVWSQRVEADDWDRFIAWKEGDVEKAWWSLNQHEEPLRQTLHSFVDLSRGASQTVPQLLLPGLFPYGSSITYLTGLKLIGWEKIDGRWAYKLQGKRQGQELKLWIDSREFLILKIYQEEKVRSLNLATTTTYKPQINAGIAPGKLGFNPPLANAPARVAAGSRPEPPVRLLLQNDQSKPEDPELSLGRKKKKSKRNDFPGASNGKKLILNANHDDVVEVDTTLVALDVLVLDQQRNTIQGLTASDFNITEDGFPERVTTFTHGDDPTRPRSIVLIIDYSGSQLPFFNESVAAAKTLVDQLNPKDRMAIVTDDVSVLVDFTRDKVKLKEKLDSLWDAVANKRRLGRSAQYSALMATLDRLAKETKVHPIIIFQTDGDELATLRPDASYPPPLPVTSDAPESEFSIADVVSTALRSRATIYTVIPGIRLIELPLNEQLTRAKLDWETRSAAREKLRPGSLKSNRPLPEQIWPDEHWQKLAATIVWVQTALVNLSKVSGGWAEFLESPDQAADLYSRILSDINQRYIVGYQPINKERDGKLRRVTVEVRGHPEYRVLGRSSYYAPGPER